LQDFAKARGRGRIAARRGLGTGHRGSLSHRISRQVCSPPRSGFSSVPMCVLVCASKPLVVPVLCTWSTWSGKFLECSRQPRHPISLTHWETSAVMAVSVTDRATRGACSAGSGEEAVLRKHGREGFLLRSRACAGLLFANTPYIHLVPVPPEKVASPRISLLYRGDELRAAGRGCGRS